MPVYGGWFRGSVQEEPEITFKNVKKAAIKAEEIGLESIWVPDHLLNPLKGDNFPCLEAWTTLTALATITKSVKIAHTTLCQGFRYPAVLAKMSTTLSEISNGRFIFSIGAGWFKREFDSYGVPWHNHDTRVARTRKQIEIIKSFWSNESTDFNGSFFTIENGVMEPKPKIPPEIWYGGESEASRKLVADLADCWLMYATHPEEVHKKITAIHPLLNGREIEYALSAHVLMGKSDEEAKNKLNKLSKGKINTINQIMKTGLVGSPETINERIQAFKDAGINHLFLKFSHTVEDLEALGEILTL